MGKETKVLEIKDKVDEYDKRGEALEAFLAFLDELRADILAGKYNHENSGIIVCLAEFMEDAVPGGNDVLSKSFIIGETLRSVSSPLLCIANNPDTRMAMLTALEMTNQSKANEKTN